METLPPDHEKNYIGKLPGNPLNLDEFLLPEMCTVESGKFYCKIRVAVEFLSASSLRIK